MAAMEDYPPFTFSNTPLFPGTHDTFTGSGRADGCIEGGFDARARCSVDVRRIPLHSRQLRENQAGWVMDLGMNRDHAWQATV